MTLQPTAPYLRRAQLLRERIPDFAVYPYSLPAVSCLESLEFHPKVTYLVGENGMGKSTLMEALAVAWGFNPEGGTLNFNFSTASTHSPLYEAIRLVRGIRRPRDGFFFRAESYYNFASNMDTLDKEFSFGPPIRESYGGKSLHEQSHGESFFAAFLHRFSGNGLYLLDEPEAALSPFRQMAMLSRMHQLIRKDSQFVIATHSPILMAYPDAVIYQLTDTGLERRKLEETDHYLITREFLNNPRKMLNELLDDGEEGD
ncbi:AAA family ATPase [Gorillibacterium timonense]|uniref:AAA family ATPase n=1 Tax=Gorillibacterium timonense TaxID=1689269 RepID=UPI00071E2ACB|nr:AAA family ATPase [Gorillibacterium timonense]